jgi:hypothetical protein
MHDAAEAYVSDLPCPVKINVEGFKEIEEKVLLTIFEAFNLAPPSEEVEEAIKVADMRMLLTERRDLMKEPPCPWGIEDEFEPYPKRIKAWGPGTMKQAFIKRAQELGVEYR